MSDMPMRPWTTGPWDEDAKRTDQAILANAIGENRLNVRAARAGAARNRRSLPAKKKPRTRRGFFLLR